MAQDFFAAFGKDGIGQIGTGDDDQFWRPGGDSYLRRALLQRLHGDHTSVEQRSLVRRDCLGEIELSLILKSPLASQ